MARNLSPATRPDEQLDNLARPIGTTTQRGEPEAWTRRQVPGHSVLRPSMRPSGSSDQDDQAAGAAWTDAMPENLRHIRRRVKRRFLHALNAANAANDLEELPRDGETIHVIMRGNWHAWDLVPAVLRLSKCRIDTLRVATLGFNKDNAVELANLLDQGSIGRVRFLCSVYFRDATQDVYQFLAAELANRGQQLLAMRNHAKLLLFEMENGARYVVESSANLRSCRNVEQFALSNDRGLLDFHAGWIDEQFAQGGHRK